MTKRKPRWTDRDPSERRMIVNSLFVDRPNFSAIITTMNKLREDHREGKETTCMTVVGKPGVGKSALLKRYARANKPVVETTEEGVSRRHPVVYAELDPDTTVNGAAETILKVIVGDKAPTGSVVRTSLLPNQLKIREVELLIIDEFQHVGERGAAKTRNKTADWVKSITKKLNIPVVMAGVPVVQQLVEDNDQLLTITPYFFVIPTYDIDDPDHRAGFREFLSDLDPALPFDQLSKLNDPERAARLHLASSGSLRHLHRIVAEAARSAIRDNAYCVTDEHFYDACEDPGVHPDCAGNPFEDGYDAA